MRAVEAFETDLTAKARIRQTAMGLFAANGVTATSIREVARAANVSPGLVIHHFETKAGLCQAVDEWVVERFLLALSEVPIEEQEEGDLLSRRVEQMAKVMRGHPTLCDYLARALSERTAASADLFHRLFSSAQSDARLEDVGAIRQDSDAFWRALQQLILVVGPLMLRPLIERELGGSLLAEDNFERWMQANVDLLRHGIYST